MNRLTWLLIGVVLGAVGAYMLMKKDRDKAEVK